VSNHDEAFPASGHIALAALTVEIRGMKEAVAELRTDIREGKTSTVSRNEWEQRNKTVDDGFSAVDKRIAALSADIASKRIPWTSIAAIIIAGAVLLFDLIPNLAN
jgi:hypothetical protein